MVPLSVTGGTPSVTRVTVPAGAVESPPFVVTQSGTAQATVDVGTLQWPRVFSFSGIGNPDAGGLPLTLFPEPRPEVTAAGTSPVTVNDNDSERADSLEHARMAQWRVRFATDLRLLIEEASNQFWGLPLELRPRRRT